MELVTLNPYLQPDRLIENYESLIWSERYSQPGDFELVSYDISKTMAQLPLESRVCLRESIQPMVVEAHKISKPKNKPAFVTVTGRVFESILERRVSVISMPSGSARLVWNVNADKQSDAAYKAIRQVIGDRFARSNLPIVTPALSPLDEFVHPTTAPGGLAGTPLVNLPLPADYSTGLTTAYEIKPGNLYGVVLELLEISHRGMRSVRPTANSGKTTIDIEIYNGADLRSSVVFDARFDQIDAATYLLSYQGSTNIAYIYGGTGANAKGQIVRKNTAGAEVSSLDRRILLIDEGTDANLATDAARTSRSLVELYKNNAIAIFDGETSEKIGALYNKPIANGGYGLGDIVKLNGEYGLSRTVRVAEFIRTSDNTGTRAYPAFQAVDE